MVYVEVTRKFYAAIFELKFIVCHLFQQLFKEGRYLISKNGMVFHIWMTCTTVCLHRFEKKCRDGLVRRIQAYRHVPLLS